MNIRNTRREDNAEINLTPLIDVVFLLLIFFMVSTTFERESAIRIDLPSAAIEATTMQANVIDLTISPDGRFFVNEQLVINTKTSTLKKALIEVLAGRTDVTVLISADATTTHQAVITAMDAARQAGILKLSLATKQSTGDE